MAQSDPAVVDRPLPTVARDSHDTPQFTTTTTEPGKPPPPPPPPPPPTTVPPPKILPSDVLFDTGSAQLKPGAVDYLRGLAAEIQKASPGARIIVTGHTDSRGSVPANQLLSVGRAQSVSGVFVLLGFNPAQVNFTGAGESRPVRPDAPGGRFDEAAGQANRRVEIQVVP